MLSDERKTQLLALLDEAPPSGKLSYIASLQTSEELQYFATVYNWDDGLAVPFAIAEHPKCDLGVALELFWLAEAQCWLTGEIQPSAYNQEWIKLCQFVTDGILSRKFVKGQTSFRSGLGVARIYQYKKKGVPEILLTDVQGSETVSM